MYKTVVLWELNCSLVGKISILEELSASIHQVEWCHILEDYLIFTEERTSNLITVE
jgi:hypothetical protein